MHPFLSIHASLDRTQLVGLGKDDAERNAALAQPVNKLAVYLLLVVAHIDEHEDVSQLLALQNITAYHLFQLFLYGLRALCETIARKVNQIPFVVDDKVVDKQRLARCG